jgi:hypothetical protein
MGFRSALGCAWGQGHAVGGGEIERRWTVQVGEMISRLIVEALHPGLITWGSFLGDSIFCLFASVRL